jgi:hypothetical protein
MDVMVDITAVQGVSFAGDTRFTFEISEGGFGGSQIAINILEDSGVYEYRLSGDGNVSAGISWVQSTIVGTHYLRFTRSGTTVKAWVWVNDFWQWDGDLAGWTHDGTWNLNPRVSITWGDEDFTNWIEGTCRFFCISEGSKI